MVRVVADLSSNLNKQSCCPGDERDNESDTTKRTKTNATKNDNFLFHSHLTPQLVERLWNPRVRQNKLAVQTRQTLFLFFIIAKARVPSRGRATWQWPGRMISWPMHHHSHKTHAQTRSICVAKCGGAHRRI